MINFIETVDMRTSYRDREIHYTVQGSGDTMVLLHGFLESKEIWDGFLPELTNYGRIVTIDLPGHGDSEVIEKVHTMELMAESVFTILKILQVKDATIIGHSMGGYVALAFLEKYRGMVNSIILINSTPLEDSQDRKNNRDRAVKIVERNKKAYITMAISNLVPPESEQIYVKEINKIKERAYKFPESGISAALAGMKIRTNRTEVLKEFTGNKIIVAGKNDPLLESEQLKNVAHECKCRFFEVPGGHLSYIEGKDDLVKLCISSKK